MKYNLNINLKTSVSAKSRQKLNIYFHKTGDLINLKLSKRGFENVLIFLLKIKQIMQYLNI